MPIDKPDSSPTMPDGASRQRWSSGQAGVPASRAGRLEAAPGVDFDNDSAFVNDVVVPWCRQQKLEVTRSRAYKKNDQVFGRLVGALIRARGNHC